MALNGDMHVLMMRQMKNEQREWDYYYNISVRPHFIMCMGLLFDVDVYEVELVPQPISESL